MRAAEHGRDLFADDGRSKEPLYDRFCSGWCSGLFLEGEVGQKDLTEGERSLDFALEAGEGRRGFDGGTPSSDGMTSAELLRC